MTNKVSTTSIALVNEDGAYSITIPKIEADMEVMIHELIIPILLAAGYHPDSVERYIESW